jgi:hypothetical protein
MARSSYVKGKKNKEDRFAILIIFLVLLMAIGVSIFFYLNNKNNISIIKDQNSNNYLCPEDGPYGDTTILIDKTDPFNETQILDIKRKILFEKESLQKHTRLSVFVINDKKIKVKSVFSICNPGDKSDITNFDQKLAPDFYQKQYEKKFEAPLNDVLEVLNLVEKADTSPIMEMIQHVSVSTFPLEKSKFGNRLIIISDMIQNSPPVFSMYSSYDFESFKKSSYYKKINTDLRGASIYILKTRQPGFEHLQGENLIKFWQKYFKDMGSGNFTIDPVEG